MVAGALNTVSAASEIPSIKRFVYTPSCAAILLPKPNVELNYSTEDWNIEAVEAAWKPPPYRPERALAVHAASKTEAEQRMWEFIKEEKPGFRPQHRIAQYDLRPNIFGPATSIEWTHT